MGELVPQSVWIAAPFVISAGAALLTAILLHYRAAAALADQRAALVEARALLATQHRAMEERIRAAEQEARRKALDEFLADVKVEERRFLLEERSTMLLQERVSFRGVPLTPWIEREIPAATPVPIEPPQPVAVAPAAPVARIVSERRPRLLGHR